MKKNKIFFYPLLLAILIFLIDKIFTIREIQLLTQKDATFLYYQYKEKLFEKLKETYKERNKKILIIIGSSRLMFINYSDFKKIYPEWELFNFSVPVNSPAYYLYTIEKIIKEKIKPNLVILETDPFQFNEYSPGFRKSNLPYTFDLTFVIKYFNLFEREEVSEFLGYLLFAGKKYPPDLFTLIERIQNPQDKLLKLFHKTIEYQEKNNGCGLPPIPIKEWYVRNLSEIEQSAKGTLEWLYKDYKFSERQWIFLKKTNELLKTNQIHYIFVKPQLSPITEEILNKNPKTQIAYSIWKEKMKEITIEEKIIDFSKNKNFFCNTFVDASHMSLECYDPLLYEIIGNYYKENK